MTATRSFLAQQVVLNSVQCTQFSMGVLGANLFSKNVLNSVPRALWAPFCVCGGTFKNFDLRLCSFITTVPSTIVPCKNWGIYPSNPGIYPMTTGIKLDLCFCTIPTVGFYGKHGEVTSPPSFRNHCIWIIRPPLMTSPPPICHRLPSPAVTRRRRCPPAIALRRKKMSLTHSVGTGVGVTLC
jgi:hypothetical protein